MTAPDYGSKVFAAWRDEAAEAWRDYTHHPFVAGLADGALPRASFVRYLAQDYIFLGHFARAWALAVVKAGDIAEMRAAAAMVDALVNHEMRLHVDTCAAAGLSEEALAAVPEATENLAYTRYVIDAGLSGDFLDLMSALGPCVLGYGEIGARLGREATSGAYCGWIGAYAGCAYQELCASVGALIDRAAAARLGDAPTASPRWRLLSERFATATRLEAGFWTMGLRGRP